MGLRFPPSIRPVRALDVIEESPWTRNWDHLTPVRRVVWKRYKLRHTSLPTPVPASDRIKRWNIVPGDRIRVRGDKDGSIREVFGINRYRNLVFLKARQEQEVPEGQRPTPPSVPYSWCQLYIGDREFPPLQGETEPRVTPVFASRLGCTAPKYIVPLGRFDWERFAVQTIPRLGDRSEKIKISIPWPKPSAPVVPAIDAYDTPADIAKEITWHPSSLFYPPSNRSQTKSLQDAYLHSIRPPPGFPPALKYDQNSYPAMEYALGDELSNPNSRAKKQRRFRQRIKVREIAHEQFLQAELVNLDGRTRKEALVEAEWKWAELQRKEERERKKKQWMLRGGTARLKRKRQRKERKQRRETEKMRNLVLHPAPNQVLPSSQPSSQI